MMDKEGKEGAQDKVEPNISEAKAVETQKTNEVAPDIESTDFAQRASPSMSNVKFGVSKQLGLGFGILVLLTVLLAAVALRGHLHAERVIDDVVEGYGSTAYLALQARNDFLSARHAEKEYLLYYRESGMQTTQFTYADTVRQHLLSMQMHVNSAEVLLDDSASTEESQSLIDLVHQERVDYEETFFEMVRLLEQRGNHYQGLEKKFHDDLNQMEALLLKHRGETDVAGIEHLSLDLLKIKKHEQSYLLNKNNDALRQVQEEAKHLLSYMGKYPADNLRSQLKKHLLAYQKHFKRWVEVDKQAELSTQRFDASAQLLEKTLMQWYDLTSAHVKNVEHVLEDGLKRDRSILVGVAVLVVLIGLLIATVLSRRIGGAVRRVSDAANQLAEGDLSSHVVVHDGDEFGELAKAFNAMSGAVVSKNYAENIFRSLSESLIVLDGKSRIVEVNRATLEMLGYQEKELRGQTIDTILRGHVKTSLMDSRSEFLAGESNGGLMNIERTYFAKDGRKIAMLFSASELLDDQQNLIGTVCVAQDLTAYKAMESELQEKQTQLIHAGRLTALGEMGAGIAHEINQPLNSISLATQWLAGEMKKKPDNEMALETVQDIQEQIARVSKIIKNMRSFSRRGQDGTQEAKAILLHPCIDVAFSFFKEQFDKDKIQLLLDIGEQANIPMVKIDPQKFEQMVVNFCSNARYAVDEQASDAAPDFEKKIQIRLFHDAERHLVVFEVEDNGCGMVSEQRERCLEPFYTTKPVGEGTGLGLSIVHSIVKEFNMGFEIVSGVGTGTTVRIEMEAVGD